MIAAYLRRVRGAVADPERIVICAGFAQGFNLVLRALAQQGVGTIAFEDPGHADDRGTAERWGLNAIPVPVDEHGLDAEALSRSGARGVLLTPAHQSPSGVVLAPWRRQAIAAWADAADATVIEDDYDRNQMMSTCRRSCRCAGGWRYHGLGSADGGTRRNRRRLEGAAYSR